MKKSMTIDQAKAVIASLNWDRQQLIAYNKQKRNNNTNNDNN